MKRILIVGLILVLAAGVAFARPRNGTFTGTAPSYNPAASDGTGSISVQIVVRGRQVREVTVTNATDTAAFVTMVTSAMVPEILRTQGTNVDLVTGATYTAIGFRNAVAAALAAAR